MRLQTQFADRDELATYIRQQFPRAAERGHWISPIQGGRTVAEKLIKTIDPASYARTRNMLDGEVTRLSPYLHHGVVTLAEIKRHILAHTTPQQAQKLLQELAWRDYFQRVYKRLSPSPHNEHQSARALDHEIWQDIEASKTGVKHYEESLPEDIVAGRSGMACIDAFVQQLHETGYLHNHARMWLAAYTVHHRRISWQAGAYWFLQHLLDGDLASNNLSWQWVASTFGAKPYYFNRENLARYTHNAYCQNCPLQTKGCPFDASYEALAERLFPNMPATPPSGKQSILQQRLVGKINRQANHKAEPRQPDDQNVLIWLHEESLNPTGPALSAHPQSDRHFIFDEGYIEQAGWSLKRLVFIYECLLEIPGIQIHRGQVPAILHELIESQNASGIASTVPVQPRLQQVLTQIGTNCAIQVYRPEEYIPGRDTGIQTRRIYPGARYLRLTALLTLLAGGSGGYTSQPIQHHQSPLTDFHLLHNMCSIFHRHMPDTRTTLH